MKQKIISKKSKEQELPDVVYQLEQSLKAIEEGRIRRVR